MLLFGTEKNRDIVSVLVLHENTSMKILEVKKNLLFELNKKVDESA